MSQGETNLVPGVEQAVIEELRRVAQLRGLSLPPAPGPYRLVDELGLRSLDLAQLVAMLGRRLGVDPFLKDVPITQVRTVADLVAAYVLGLRQAQGASHAAAEDA